MKGGKEQYLKQSRCEGDADSHCWEGILIYTYIYIYIYILSYINNYIYIYRERENLHRKHQGFRVPQVHHQGPGPGNTPTVWCCTLYPLAVYFAGQIIELKSMMVKWWASQISLAVANSCYIFSMPVMVYNTSPLHPISPRICPVKSQVSMANPIAPASSLNCK